MGPPWPLWALPCQLSLCYLISQESFDYKLLAMPTDMPCDLTPSPHQVSFSLTSPRLVYGFFGPFLMDSIMKMHHAA